MLAITFPVNASENPFVEKGYWRFPYIGIDVPINQEYQPDVPLAAVKSGKVPKTWAVLSRISNSNSAGMEFTLAVDRYDKYGAFIVIQDAGKFKTYPDWYFIKQSDA
jgi:hypothetical protein